MFSSSIPDLSPRGLAGYKRSLMPTLTTTTAEGPTGPWVVLPLRAALRAILGSWLIREESVPQGVSNFMAEYTLLTRPGSRMVESQQG